VEASVRAVRCAPPELIGRAEAEWRRATGAADVAIYSTELGMVEEIKELRPELEPRCFTQPGILQQSHIPVVQARPVKERRRLPSVPIGSVTNCEASKKGAMIPPLRGFSL